MSQPWQPLESGVAQLVALLNEFQKPGSNQAQMFQQLEQYKQFPDFNNYLSYIFSKADSLPVEVRQSAGLVLKNNLKAQYAAITEEFRTYIKGVLLPVIALQSRPLRQTGGTVASVIVGLSGLEAWPELVGAISQCLQSEDLNAVDGALDTLFKIIEDHPMQLDSCVASANGVSASSLVVPPLLRLMQSPQTDIRRQAIACLNMMAKDMPTGMCENVDAYLQGLFALANDTEPSVRKEVCIGLVSMMVQQPEKLQPFLYQIIEYMLASNEHDDEGVALESAEFWGAFCEAQLDPELLRPYLPRLIPMLMKNMVFEEYDDEVTEGEAAESQQQQQEERDQDLKPFHHKQKEHTTAEEDGEEDDDSAALSRWNLRKCSAAGLDRLSTVYHEELLPVLLPIVEQRLQNTDWRARESAILALGAVSEGCHQGLLPYLDGMVHMLLPKLLDARPMVRIISCWALSRYSHWLLLGIQERGAAAKQLLDDVMMGVLKCVLDHNKFVQQAACSAVATLEETAGSENAVPAIQPHVRAIVEHLSVASTRYTRRNLRLVYDALGTLADAIGGGIGEPQLVSLYLPPLMQRYMALDVDDKDIMPLMECLTTLSPSIAMQLTPYAQALFEKAVRVATTQLELQQAQALGAMQHVEYDRDFVVCALDMMSGMAEGLGVSIESLVAVSPLLQVLVHCSRDADSDVRQSAFALVGDLSKACVGRLVPALSELVTNALACFEPQILNKDNMKAANNACWSLGELVIKVEPECLNAYAERIASNTTAILSATGRMPRSILENCAITLGRIAWRCPEPLAPHLALFCSPWCAALRNIRDDVEKEHAFLGLCRLIRLNPEGAMQSFHQLCAAIVSWKNIACEGLRNELAQIMQVFKVSLTTSGRWQQMMSQLDVPVQQKLVAMCHL